MQRVVWIAAFIMGLLLIGLTTGLMVQRRGSSAPEVVVVSVPNAHQTVYRLGLPLHHDGREIWHKMGAESAGITSLGPSPDGQWLYLRRIYPTLNGVEFNVERIRLDGLRRESLPNLHPYTSIFWSSDGQWMVYKQSNAQTGRDELWRASTDGTQTQNLTPDFPHLIEADYPLPPILDPANAWVAFSAYEFDGLTQAYRIDFPAGQVTQLTDDTDMPAYGRAHFRNSSGDWLVITRPDGAYRMRVDGSEMTPLLTNDRLYNFSVTLWPSAGLILIEPDDRLGGDLLYAVSMDDFSVRWTLPNMGLAPTPVGRSYALGFGAEGAVYAIDAQGHTKQVAPLFANMPTYQWSPDERWLVYTMGGHLYAVTMPDGVERDLYNGSNRVAVLEWADDGESVVIMEDAGTGFSLWRVGLADGHKKQMMAYREGVQYLGIGRLRDWEVDGFGLLTIGCVLTAISAVRLARRRKS